MTHDHVLLQPEERVPLALYGRLGQHAGRFLESCRRDETVGTECRLGDALQQRLVRRRVAALAQHAVVFRLETATIYVFAFQKIRVARVVHLDLLEHLTHDDFHVLVVDAHALHSVDFLDMVDQVFLHGVHPLDLQNVVGVDRPFGQGFARLHPVAVAHAQVPALGNLILPLGSIVGPYENAPGAPDDAGDLYDAVHLRHRGALFGFGPSRLEELGDARQAAGDVPGPADGARQAREDRAGFHVGALGIALVRELGDEQVGAGGQVIFVLLLALGVRDVDARMEGLLSPVLRDHLLPHARGVVQLFTERLSRHDVFKLHVAGMDGDDRDVVGVPLEQGLVLLDVVAVFREHDRAVGDVEVGPPVVVGVQDGNLAGPADDDGEAVLLGDGLNRGEDRLARLLRGNFVLRGVAARDTADVEGAERQLRTRLADALRRHDADGLAHFHHGARGEVPAVAPGAHAALGLAGQHGPDVYGLAHLRVGIVRVLHAAALFDEVRGFLVDLLAAGRQQLPRDGVVDVFKHDPAQHPVAQRFHDVLALFQGADLDAADRAAVRLVDDHVLRHVHQPPGKISGFGGLQGRVGQSLAPAVAGGEVLEHREPFLEVGQNGRLDVLADLSDDLPLGLGHEAAHAAQLSHLVQLAPRAGGHHHVEGIEAVVRFLQRGLDDFVQLGPGVLPHVDHLVVALALGDGVALVLFLDGQHLGFRVTDHLRLLVGDDHVVDARRQARKGRVVEAQPLDFVEEHAGAVVPQLAVYGGHHVPNGLAVEHLVLEADLRRQDLVEDDPADGRFHHLPLVAQLDHGMEIHEVVVEGEHHLGNAREDLAFAPAARELLGQVVASQDDVLAGRADRLPVLRIEDVVRGQHQHPGLDLGLEGHGDVHRHLVAVEVGVEGFADERMDADGLAFHEHRHESLDTQPVQGGRPVQQDRVVLDDLLEDVPDLGFLAFNDLLRALDRLHEAPVFQPLDDEGLEELQGDVLGQPALVDLELGFHHDHGTARVVHPLAEQVLAETPLLALEQVREGLEGTVPVSPHGPRTAAVVEQRVHRFLQHALLVAQDDVGRADLEQFLEPVVPVDDAPVQVVEIGGGEPSAFQGHQRPQVGRDDRQHFHDHPFGPVAVGVRSVGVPERLDHLQPLQRVVLPLYRRFHPYPGPQLDGKLFDVDLGQQAAQGARAHVRLELMARLLEVHEGVLVDDLADLVLGVSRVQHDVGLVVDHPFQVPDGEVQQVADAAGGRLEIPDMADRDGQLDVSEPFPPHLRLGDFHAATVADDAAVTDPLVLAAVAFPVLHGTEDAFAEEAVAFRLEGPVVDGLRFRHFPVGPPADRFGGGQLYPDRTAVLGLLVH